MINQTPRARWVIFIISGKRGSLGYFSLRVAPEEQRQQRWPRDSRGPVTTGTAARASRESRAREAAGRPVQSIRVRGGRSEWRPGAPPHLVAGARGGARSPPPRADSCYGAASGGRRRRRGAVRTGAPERGHRAFPPPAGSALLTLRAAGRWRWKLATWKKGSFPTRTPT